MKKNKIVKKDGIVNNLVCHTERINSSKKAKALIGVATMLLKHTERESKHAEKMLMKLSEIKKMK